MKLPVRRVASICLVIALIFVSFTLRSIGESKLEREAEYPSAPDSQNQPVFTHQDLLIATNEIRKPPLVALELDPVLNSTAQDKCLDMVQRDDYSHGDYQKIADKLARGKFGENLAFGRVSARTTVSEWAASPGHYTNLTDSDFTKVGFGICPFRGYSLIVQHFSE